MKRLIVTTALVLLAVPATAHGWSIHTFTVRDAGPELVFKVTVCDPSPYIVHVNFRTRAELEDGGDGHGARHTGRQDKRCVRWTLTQDDTLRYRGTYFGRVRVSLRGEVRYTGWRSFQSS